MRYPSVVLAGFFLANCANVPVDVGTGPIELSPEAQGAYERYASSRAPTVFVVSEDGRNFQYSYCEDARCLKGGGTARAIAECQIWSDGERCYVYDRLGKIVWDKEKAFRGPDKDRDHACSYAANPPEERIAACSEVLDAVDLRPRDQAVTYRRRAVAYIAVERHQDAIADFSAVLDNEELKDQLDITDRSFSKWYLDRGEAYEVLGDLENAERDYRSALEHFPGSTAAQEALQDVSS